MLHLTLLHLQDAQGSVFRTSQACGAHVGTNTGYFTCYISLLHGDEWRSGGYPFTGTVKNRVASGMNNLTPPIGSFQFSHSSVNLLAPVWLVVPVESLTLSPKVPELWEVLNLKSLHIRDVSQVWFWARRDLRFIATSNSP